jgi:hypothetical protein
VINFLLSYLELHQLTRPSPSFRYQIPSDPVVGATDRSDDQIPSASLFNLISIRHNTETPSFPSDPMRSHYRIDGPGKQKFSCLDKSEFSNCLTIFKGAVIVTKKTKN